MKKILIAFITASVLLMLCGIARAQTNPNPLAYAFLNATDLANRVGNSYASVVRLYIGHQRVADFTWVDTSTERPVRNWIIKNPTRAVGRWIRVNSSNEEIVETLEDRDSIPLSLRLLHLRVSVIETGTKYELNDCTGNNCWVPDSWITSCDLNSFSDALPSSYLALALDNTVDGRNTYNAAQIYKDTIIGYKGINLLSGSLNMTTGDIALNRSGAEIRVSGKTTGKLSITTAGTDTGRIYANGLNYWYLSGTNLSNPLAKEAFSATHIGNYYHFLGGAATAWDTPFGEGDTLTKTGSGTQTFKTITIVQQNSGTVTGRGYVIDWRNTGNTSTSRAQPIAIALNGTTKTKLYADGDVESDSMHVNTTPVSTDSTTNVPNTKYVKQRIAEVKALIPSSGSSGINSYEGKANQASFNPANGSSYTIGDNTTPTAAGGVGTKKIYLAKSGTIKKASIFINVSGTLASSETATLTCVVNGTDTYTIASNITMSSANQQFKNVSLSIPIANSDYTDYIEFRLQCPTWTTVPTSISTTVRYYIETN